jgi:putative membrane protein
MKRKRFQISDSDRKRIENAVKAAEANTSGEIVPFIVPDSDSYWWVHALWGGLGWVVSSLVLWIVHHERDWGFALVPTLFWQSAGMVFGFALAFLPFFRRLVIPGYLRRHNVHREVLANFVVAGLTATRDRTGVLLYLSILERRIEILADTGISEKLPSGYWQNQVDTIVRGIHQGSPVDVFCEVIEVIGKDLAEHFPPRADDTNELSDRVHLNRLDD